MGTNRRRNQCPIDPCHTVSDWYSKYDNFACLVCDIWTSPSCNCTPEECEFKAAEATRPERPSMCPKKVIILFGEMGAGKNYHGERLAEERGMYFLDGDLFLPSKLRKRVNSFQPLSERQLDDYIHGNLYAAILNKAELMPKGVVVAQALYRDRNRIDLEMQLRDKGIEVEYIMIQTPFFQHMKQLWSRKSGFKWLLYGLRNKPFFQKPTHRYSIILNKGN